MSLSFPPFPQIRSESPNPEIVSFPPRPTMTSRPFVPWMWSSPFVPTIVAVTSKHWYACAAAALPRKPAATTRAAIRMRMP
jgi:hypothetical protein